MVKYEDINLTAVCCPKTMDSLMKTLPLVNCSHVRAVRYGIVTVMESLHCEPGVLMIIKDDEYEKLQEYKRNQKELDEKLTAFNNSIEGLISEQLK